jgi:hypothetical protein
MGKTWTQKILLASVGIGLALESSLTQAAIYDRNGNKLPDADVNSLDVNWELLSAEQGRNYNGVGSLEKDAARFCTAFFLDSKGSDNAPAYAVTNGHCYDVPLTMDSQEILTNQPSTIVFKLNYFVNQETRVRSIPVRQVVYATMKGTDITILELNTTFRQLVSEGFTPLPIAPTTAPVGEPVEVIGIPLTGVQPSLTFLHRAVCELGESVNLREHIYHWDKSIRHNCSTVGGMSGSPVVSLNTNRVVAIVNTGVNDDALLQPECSVNRPCEISRDGRVTTVPQANYAQRVNHIPSCFDRKGIFNLDLLSCQLEKP